MKPSRILLVEDDAVARIALSSVIQWHGVHVRAEGDADGGLAALSESYDVIACDVMLPGAADGGLVLLREAARLKAAPILIVMTAVSDPEILAEASELCGGRVFRKPLDPPRLLAAMGLV